MDELNKQTSPPQVPPTSDQMHSSFENSHGSKLIPIIIAAILLALVGIGSYVLGTKNSQTPAQKACTMEAKLCPDGTSVGRTGPKCEFSPCPTLTSDPTANWKTYISQEGKYSIKYPANVKIYVNEKLSVDGAKVPLKDTAVLLSDTLPGLNANYQMSINHKLTSSSTLNDFVDKNSSCVSIDASKGKLYTLGGKQALIFENTPCGPYGMTSIYSLSSGLGYIIEVETHAGYNDIKKYIDEILSTFKFTDQNQTVDETADWKIYNSVTGKFSVRYPTEWNVVSGGGIDTGTETISFGHEVTGVTEDSRTKVWIQMQSATNPNSPIKNAEDYKNSLVRTYDTNPDSNLSTTLAVIDNVNAFKINYVDAGSKITNVVMDKDGLIYSIVFRETKPYAEQDLQAFNQILSTFKFTN